MAGIAVLGQGLGVPTISFLVLITAVSGDKPAPPAIGAVLGEECSYYNSAGILLSNRCCVFAAENGLAEDLPLSLEQRRGQSWRCGIPHDRAG
jgi:hypothetical protein